MLKPPFSAAYAPDDREIAQELLRDARLTPEQDQRIDATASRLIAAIRNKPQGFGGVEDMLREFSLSTREGLALMILAEALLRVPDAATADRFIEDKLGQGDFAHHDARSDALLVNASAWALGLSARVVQPGETPQSLIGRLAKRIGVPAIRAATRQAMRLMGNHFVLGETIEAALRRAADHRDSERDTTARYSFDMLGEGARTAADAKRYLASYTAAIAAIGRAAGNARLPDRPGISIKLSALHPRFEALNRAAVLDQLVPIVIGLARQAKSYDLNFTIDAEEADRLELSLDVIAMVARDESLAGWDGFGLAIQAYQKRAEAVIEFIAALAEQLDRRMMVRLVKGAYWDTEIKRAQERGLDGYPVFTRKAMTDLNYVACAKKLLDLRPRIFPQFATHNALTVATIIELAGDGGGYEFQRLHGMGDALYFELARMQPTLGCRTYAPVGHHRDLLAYLVRRLLENGANTSFVAQASDPGVPVTALLKRPADIIATPEGAANGRLPLPRDLFRPDRQNSRGVEFGDRAAVEALHAEIDAARSDSLPVKDATPDEVGRAVASAHGAFAAWSATDASHRADVLDTIADLFAHHRGRLLGLLQSEARKTIDDAMSELREAIDFCRYYAAEGRKLFTDQPMPGPTGEGNVLRLRGRGAIAAISPWNFPLAIFTGQVVAALMAGNTVVAKPAEQTPLIAIEAVKLMHRAGVPRDVLQLVIGDGAIGAALIADARIAGIVFTGSMETAQKINRTLAAKDGPIVPLIAETGGINAMIVDATALPEQVADDVVMSAFRSAGQRCSALRLLFVQDDVADRMVEMIAGAARELRIGDPADWPAQIGPVIDAEAKAALDAHIATMKATAKLQYAGVAPADGTFVAPHIFELKHAGDLTREVFGPVLHVVRYRAEAIDDVLRWIERSGYGLTLGIHSRIDEFVERVTARLAVGNIYVNRNMIGAVVGVQPFGGHGLSGTGPKAGGPHYLARFATEQTVTINTAAAGGNAALMAGE